MTKPKKKLLPKNFEALLKNGDIAALQAVFDTCDVNARGGYGKQTALAYDQCPDALARWLVAQGADLSATDTWGNTPLHRRARSRQGRIDVLLELGADVHNASSAIGTPLHAAADSHHARNAWLLLQHGAGVDAVNREGLTPLELALRGCNNIDLEDMVLLGGTNWDAGFKRMADAFLQQLRGGTPLPLQDLQEAEAVVAEVKRKSGDPARLAQLALKWVLQNPQPTKLEPPPPYDR